MKLLRRNFLAIVTGSLLSLVGHGANAANGPLIKPTKVGQVVIFRNKKYTSLKKGKALVWDNGVPVTAAPSASAQPITSAASSPLTFVAKVGEIEDGHSKVIVVKPASGASFSVAVTRAGSTFIAVSATCTHSGCIVEVVGTELACPCHRSLFNLTTGAVLQGPAQLALKKYVVSEDAGSIYLKL